jgi:competence ComEA-like helix-hairpin-helix protein
MYPRWQQRIVFALLSLTLLFTCVDAALAKKKPPSYPININSASSAELQMVPGIGPATAQKILQTRKAYGSFKDVNDLLAIRGIGQKRLDKMRKYLVVSKPPAARTPAHSNPGATTSAAAKPKAPPVKSAAAGIAQKKSSAPTAREEEEP